MYVCTSHFNKQLLTYLPTYLLMLCHIFLEWTDSIDAVHPDDGRKGGIQCVHPFVTLDVAPWH